MRYNYRVDVAKETREGGEALREKGGKRGEEEALEESVVVVIADENGEGARRGSFANLNLNSLAFLQQNTRAEQLAHHKSLVHSSSSSSSFSLLNRRKHFQEERKTTQKKNETDDEDYYCAAKIVTKNKAQFKRKKRRRDALLFATVLTVTVFLGNVCKTTRVLSLSPTFSPPPNLEKNSSKRDFYELEEKIMRMREEEPEEEEEEKEEEEKEKEEREKKVSLLPAERITLLSPQRMVELSERNIAYDFVSIAEKRSAIATTLKWAYDGYMKVFPADELDPLSESGLDWFHVALTAIDALDTFALVGLDEEYEFVKEFVKSGKPIFNAAGRSSVFESTIRIMGGFLAAHHLEQKSSSIEAEIDKGDGHEFLYFLEKARELADKLKIAFDTPTGIPRTDVDFSTGKAHDDEKGTNGLAQATTLTLEWECLEATLMEAVEDTEKRKKEFEKYGDYVRRANEAVHSLASDAEYGLLPDKIGVEQLNAHGMVKLGANGDSYYEYLLKSWIHRGKPKGGESEYVRAMDGIFLRLVKRTQNHEQNTTGLIYVGEMAYPSSRGARFEKKMDHLVCFLPGVLALGHLHGVGEAFGSSAVSAEEKEEFRVKMESLHLDKSESAHLALAKELMRTCVAMYERMPLGLHPEIAKFDQDSNNVVKCFGGDLCVSANDAHSILRPETVESLFVLYRVTKDESLRRHGWRMWQNWERYSRVATGGYASLASVLENPPGRKKGKQESFFLSETLKYLFLLFSDHEVIPLECFVFNTEGHPLPILHHKSCVQ